MKKFGEYKKAKAANDEAIELLDAGGMDKDFKEMVQMQLEESKEDMAKLEEELKLLLLPKDPNDERNVIIEIRGGAGGEEAALFAGSLYRMYSMYAASKGWTIEVMNANETELGGYKEITFSVSGEGAYSRLKYESGVHRVQRVPETESQGRVHTSTVTVAVLPEADEVELDLNEEKDLKIDVVPFIRSRRTAHQQNLISRKTYPHTNRHRYIMPDTAFTVPEQGLCNENAQSRAYQNKRA